MATAGQYGKAAEELQAAARILPADSDVLLQQGWVQLRMAVRLPGLLKRNLAGQAARYFRQAGEITPLEPESHYGLAQALTMQGPSEAGKALTAYRHAIALWPNNPYYHRALAETLYHQNRPEELAVAVLTLGRLYPGSSNWLRRQPFRDEPSIKAAFRRGLGEAILAGTDVPKARLARAAMLADDGDWLGAAAEYRQALAPAGRGSRPESFYQLGGYLLRGGDRAGAESAFADGLARSQSRVADLAALARTYHSLGLDPDFPPVLERLCSRYPLSKGEVVRLAEKLLEQQRLELARTLLAPLTDGRAYLAEPYFLLSRIAEREGDWVTMETMAQKAITRAPERSEYQRQLSRAQEHQRR